ncbi:Hypothetical predicted protein [Mytilus galloprovincialis]|uniref:Uncharacterized protein n=1 Tax=Mytilus galloprovincialis TaxID=29158 RepID=A0A8B6D5X0_MYTGA|nr:Hypothetical predicted protein [Mytilus galloprovincialis]
MTVQHREGVKHGNADGLSRIPTELQCPGLSTEVELSNLPCKGCEYCAKAHRQWSGFAEEVDYVVLFASKVTPAPEVRMVQGQANSRGQELDEIHVSRVMILVADGNVIVSPDTGEMSIRVIHGVGLMKYAVFEICESHSKDPELRWLVKGLKGEGDPPQGEIFKSTPHAKFYRNRGMRVLSCVMTFRPRNTKVPSRLGKKSNRVTIGTGWGGC